jgi:hypothetical protein
VRFLTVSWNLFYCRFLRVTSTSDTTVSRTTLSAEAVHKQLHYVRCLGQVISRCTFVKQVDVTLLQRSLRELITEVDGLVGNGRFIVAKN